MKLIKKIKSVIRNIKNLGLEPYLRAKIKYTKQTIKNTIALSIKENRYRIVGLLYGEKLYLDSTKIAQLELLVKEYSQSFSKSDFHKSSKIRKLISEAFRLYVAGEFDSSRQLISSAETLDPQNPMVFMAYSGLARWQQGHYSNEQLANRIKALELGINQHTTPYCFTSNLRILDKGWSMYIGHIALLDFYIKAKKLGFLSPETRILVTSEQFIVNRAYFDYFEDHIDIRILSNSQYWNYENCFKSFIEDIAVWRLRQGFSDLYNTLDLVQEQWRQQQLPPLLQIKDEHREKGLAILNKLSIPEDAWFVSLHVRGQGKGFDENDPQDGRSCDIFSYIPAIKAITQAGGYVFRMGHKGMAPLPDLPRVIDYANSPYKSDIMDVFLWSCCRFFIGTTSGPTNVPHSFGVPMLYTNVVALAYGAPGYYKSLMIPKLWRSISENRLLTFSEILQSPAGWCERRKFDSDLEMVENTSDEIEAGVIEMLDLTSSDKNLPYDFINSSHPLQIKLDAIRESHKVIGKHPVSNFFLNRHSDLIS